MTDPDATFRAALRANADGSLPDPEPLKDLMRKLQRKLEAERAVSGTTLYGLPTRRTTLVPPGEVWVIGDTDGELHEDAGYRFMRITRVAAYNPRDAAGYPSVVERWHQRTPLYTRHTLGAREAARDWRRNRRPTR